jgi:hypothetical protein
MKVVENTIIHSTHSILTHGATSTRKKRFGVNGKVVENSLTSHAGSKHI